MPCDHSFPVDYYNTKKSIKDLGLSMEKIDACKNGCMLYWKDDIDMDLCKFCREAKYKPTRERNLNRKKTPYAVLRCLSITPRLQRLYASQVTAKQMTWHPNHQTEEGSMCHPYDGKVWRHFDLTHRDFAVEPRNVRLGLCTDGFAPHGQYGRTYSCWPIILTLYNLPLGMCMSSGARDETFAMRAALMWTINDLPAYGMASGWSSAGVMGCSVYMEDTRAFYLQNSERRATLTATDSSFPPIIPIAGTRKHLLRTS
ncbi:UNVERIFIED_CONTAM: hypothetical protein Sradi_1878400 [Sesamum radiatum]|uniref:Uncharacterized protein n=1 Tax=Sesamum radiatum TaxID=300843 RepID=A0AAW2TYQ0_SESRA